MVYNSSLWPIPLLLVLVLSCSTKQLSPLLNNGDTLIDSLHSTVPCNCPTDTSFSGIRENDTLHIAHWNIGHLSLGKSDNTAINPNDSDEMSEMYHSLLDTLNIDIFGICEYNASFTRSDTRSILFGDYPYFYHGRKYRYNCNAIASKKKLSLAKETPYKLRVQTRYYYESTFNFCGKTVTFVETHLDWDEGKEGAKCRASQMSELKDRFVATDYVIICGDFNNAKGDSEFNEFRRFGFQVVNNGSLLTFPTNNPTHAIDNIICKGFRILDCVVISDESLSDHGVLRCSLQICK